MGGGRAGRDGGEGRMKGAWGEEGGEKGVPSLSSPDWCAHPEIV